LRCVEVITLFNTFTLCSCVELRASFDTVVPRNKVTNINIKLGQVVFFLKSNLSTLSGLESTSTQAL